MHCDREAITAYTDHKVVQIRPSLQASLDSYIGSTLTFNADSPEFNSQLGQTLEVFQNFQISLFKWGYTCNEVFSNLKSHVPTNRAGKRAGKQAGKQAGKSI